MLVFSSLIFPYYIQNSDLAQKSKKHSSVKALLCWFLVVFYLSIILCKAISKAFIFA